MRGNGGIIGVPNTSRNGVWTTRDYAMRINDLNISNTIIGVQNTGSSLGSAWALRRVGVRGGGLYKFDLTYKDAFFDCHPLYKFHEYTDGGGNEFVEIPIAYWWFGNLPDAVGGSTPRWTMLLSTSPVVAEIAGVSCEFKANPGAYKRNGSWMEKFYLGKYKISSGYASKANATIVVDTMSNFQTGCSSHGADYHLSSAQEMAEVVCRKILEDGTFNIFPSVLPRAYGYRGVYDMLNDAVSSSGSQICDGMRKSFDSSWGSDNWIECWEEAGGQFVHSGVSGRNNVYPTMFSSHALLVPSLLPVDGLSGYSSQCAFYRKSSFSNFNPIACPVYSGSAGYEFTYIMPSFTDPSTSSAGRLSKW